MTEGRGAGWVDGLGVVPAIKDPRLRAAWVTGQKPAMTASLRSPPVLLARIRVGASFSNAVEAVDQHRNRQVNGCPGHQAALTLTSR